MSKVKYDYNRKVTIEGKEVPWFNRTTPERVLYFTCPPYTLHDLLSLAWIAMKPGMYDPYTKASVVDIVGYLHAFGMSDELSEWAAQKAEKYYDRDKFAEFIKEYEDK